MQPTFRHFLLTLLLFVFDVPALFIENAGAADPMLIVNLAGKFKQCEGAPPGCERVLLKGDPQSEPFHSVLRFPKGWVFPKHWHVSAENLVMVRGLVTINSEGGREQTIKPGDYLYIPATLVHWGSCPEDCVFYLAVDGPDSFNVVE
jgi:quercetin dioxygenase-like cupin family protein